MIRHIKNTSRPKNGATGLLAPLSGIADFCCCPAITYYNIYNIYFVNMYKISYTFLCNIFIIELLTFPAF